VLRPGDFRTVDLVKIIETTEFDIPDTEFDVDG